MASLVTSGSLLKVLLARWYILVIGFAGSFALAAAAYSMVPPQYTSSGTAVLVQAQPRGSTSAPAPFGSLETTALIVAQSLSSSQTSSELGLAGDDAYSVSNSSSGSSSGGSEPFIRVTAQSRKAANTTEIVDVVMARAEQELSRFEASLRVDPRSRVRLETVVSASPPTRVWDPQLRTVAVAFFVGMLATIALACAFDRVATRRKIAKEPRRPVPAAATAQSPEEVLTNAHRI